MYSKVIAIISVSDIERELWLRQSWARQAYFINYRRDSTFREKWRNAPWIIIRRDKWSSYARITAATTPNRF